MFMKRVFKVIYALRWYLLSILIFAVVVALLNIFIFLKEIEWYFVSLWVLGSVVLVIIIDGITAAVIHKMPEKLFIPERFKERKGERGFFNFIRIKKWKDKIPEIGELTCDFSKSNINDPNDPKYIYKFLIEMGYAEAIHFISCLTGVLIILLVAFTLPLKAMLSISLPVIIINSGYNIISALIQRYNRPKLYKLYIRKTRQNK